MQTLKQTQTQQHKANNGDYNSAHGLKTNKSLLQRSQYKKYLQKYKQSNIFYRRKKKLV